MSKYRWMTKVLVGNWMDTNNKALADALAHGQATINEGAGEIITLRPYATMEQRSRVV